MKKCIILVLMTSFICFILSACGSPESKIIGIWINESGSLTREIVINKDYTADATMSGSYEEKTVDDNVEILWSYDDSSEIFIFSTPDEGDVEINYNEEDDTLVVLETGLVYERAE